VSTCNFDIVMIEILVLRASKDVFGLSGVLVWSECFGLLGVGRNNQRGIKNPNG